MKISNILNRSRVAAALSAAAILSATALPGCTSDADHPQPEPNQPASLSITIKSPYLASTRAQFTGTGNNAIMAATAEEAKISSLWLYIFYADGTKAGECYLAENVKGSINDVTSPQTILSGRAINAGKYRIYVVANLDKYLPTGNNATVFNPEDPGFNKANLKESDLTGLKLNFDADFAATTNSLPMAANYTNISSTSAGNNVSIQAGVVEIKSGNVQLLSEMTFLCSAVRYTFLFDPTAPTDGTTGAGFSFPYTSIKSNSLSVNHLTESAFPLYSNDTDKGATWTAAGTKDVANALSLAPKTYPNDLTEWIKKPDFLTGKTDAATDNIYSDKVAYQGIVYLPENIATESGSKCTMTWNVALGGIEGTKDFSIVLPNNNNQQCDTEVGHNTATDGENILKRGHFYDIIGKVTSSGMAFYVKVKPWSQAYIDNFEYPYNPAN